MAKRPRKPLRWAGPEKHKVETETGPRGKITYKLPARPEEDDLVGLAEWATSVLHLNWVKRVNMMQLIGTGSDAHLVIHRAGGARAIRFEPVTRLVSDRTFVTDLVTQMDSTDSVPYRWSQSQLAEIYLTFIRLAQRADDITQEERMGSLVGGFLASATEIEGYTLRRSGPPPQGEIDSLWKALNALREGERVAHRERPGTYWFLRDTETAQWAARVDHLQGYARNSLGPLRGHGKELDNWLEEIGVERRHLQAWQFPRRFKGGGSKLGLGVYVGMDQTDD